MVEFCLFFPSISLTIAVGPVEEIQDVVSDAFGPNYVVKLHAASRPCVLEQGGGLVESSRYCNSTGTSARCRSETTAYQFRLAGSPPADIARNGNTFLSTIISTQQRSQFERSWNAEGHERRGELRSWERRSRLTFL